MGKPEYLNRSPARKTRLQRFKRCNPKVWRLVTVATVLCFVQYLVLHHEYQEAMRQKYQPTIFSSLDHWPLEGNVSSINRQKQLSELPNWKPLGKGYEGQTFVNDNSVVKRFNTNTSPLRNCVPAAQGTLRWPTEIPAALLLGGLQNENEMGISDSTDFLPVQDYYLSSATASSAAKWHLVTPFVTSGALEKLARRLRPQKLGYKAIDAQFRPSVNRLLGALERMHTQHNLCHDDVKLDNIWVTSFKETEEKDTHWLLADLGNARQPGHAYHQSRLWGTANGQLSDCQANDVVRLIKSYVRFLQKASGGGDDFDTAFFEGSEPWSRLYWDVMDGSVVGNEIAAASLQVSLRHSPSEELTGGAGSVKRAAESRRQSVFRIGMKRAAERELKRQMGASEMWARIFGVIGFPASPC